MKKLVFLIIPLFVIIQTQIAVGEIYPATEYRLQGIPTYCAVIPTDEQASSTLRDIFLKYSEDAVNEWKSKLARFESVNNKIWEMKFDTVSIVESRPECNILIKIEKDEMIPEVAGFFDESGHEIRILFHPDRDNYKGFFETIVHEIGHTFGLDHYLSWSGENKTPPSIMIPILPEDPSVLKITELDITKIRMMYGVYGFYAYSNYIPDDILSSVENGVIPDSPPSKFVNLEISDNIVELKPYKPHIIKVTGKLFEEELHRGIPVYVIVQSPLNKIELIQSYPTGKGQFEIPITFDQESERGTYTIEPMYNQFVQKNMKITIQVIDEGMLFSSTQISSQIPMWIKNNARWWSEAKISDSDFISGIQYMIKAKIIMLPDSQLSVSISQEEKIPLWLKNNARWWSEDIISESEFIQSLQYLVSVGMIKVDA